MDCSDKSRSSTPLSSQSSSPSKQDNNGSQQEQNVSTTLFRMQEKLFAKEVELAEAEENLWQRSKSVFVQNMDGEATVKQTHKACQQITELLQRNARDLQLAEMRQNAALEHVKKGTEIINATTKEGNNSVEALTARFQALKARTESELEAARHKLKHGMQAEDVQNALQARLDRLLHSGLEERVQNLRKRRDQRVQSLEMEKEQLLDHIGVLESKLEASTDEKSRLFQQRYDLERELGEICRTDIGNLDEANAGKDELQRQLGACTEDCDNLSTELSNLVEQLKEVEVEKRKLNEEIAGLRAELEDHIGQENETGAEFALSRYRNSRERLQEKIKEQFAAVQDEIEQASVDLHHAEDEYTSIVALLDGQQHDWSKEIENAVIEEKQLREAIAAEQEATVAVQDEKVKIDVESTRLKLQIEAVRASNNAAELQWQKEIGDLKKYVKKLSAQEQVERLSAMDDAACELDVVEIAEPSSEGDFECGAASRPQRMNSINDNGTHTSDIRSGMQGIAEEDDERPMDSEGTGGIPSDIHNSGMEQADANGDGVVRADGRVENLFPLPTFGIPLSTDDDDSIWDATEGEGSELSSSYSDQSVWTEFSAMMK